MDAEQTNMDVTACAGCAERDRRIGQIQRRNAELERQDALRNDRIKQLEQRLEEVSRAGKRQAAPFARGAPKLNPKKPGRKSGPDYGAKAFRTAPPPQAIDEVYEAPLPPCCPRCGGPVALSHIAHQYQTEIPRRPIHRQFNVAVGRCTGCDHRVQGRHRLQTSDALGCCAAQLGPDLQAGLVQLNKDAGLAHGKITGLLKALFGIALSRGGSAQAMLRAARRCAPSYHALVESLPQQPVITPDETGWRIGGQLAWLHVFVAEPLTCYVIDPHRGVEVAQRLLGLDYAGALIHDGWAPYDRFWQAHHQTCLAHLLRRCRDLLETATRGAVRFPRQVQALLQDALGLRDRHAVGQVSDHGLAVARGRLEQRRNRLLTWTRAHPANERLAKHLHKHRDQLFTFLYHLGLDATNWRAEQALRPAVVNRKVWGGNRTPTGAAAQAILMSVLRTCAQQQRDALSFLSRTLCGQRPRLALRPAGP